MLNAYCGVLRRHAHRRVVPGGGGGDPYLTNGVPVTGISGATAAPSTGGSRRRRQDADDHDQRRHRRRRPLHALRRGRRRPPTVPAVPERQQRDLHRHEHLSRRLLHHAAGLHDVLRRNASGFVLSAHAAGDRSANASRASRNDRSPFGSAHDGFSDEARLHAYAHSSRTSLAATVAVIPLISRSGLSSTTSAPTSGARCACSTLRISRTVSPPGS